MTRQEPEARRPLTPRVAAGVPIAVVAPSHAYDPVKLEAGLAIARAHGHDLRPFPDMLAPHRYFAAPLEVRRAQLIEALTDDRYGAVWLVRGGSGLLQVLDGPGEPIPWDRLGRKPVIGFSDSIALHLALDRYGLGPGIHGPVLHSLATTDAASVAHLFALLAGEAVPALTGEAWADGAATGPLVGGNLCLLAATCGTRWQLDAAGKILVIEEIGEAPYRIERSLQQLASAGVLDTIAGAAVGTFTDCGPPAGASWSLREVVMDHLGPLGVPVLGGLPIGHGPENRAFVWGAPATIRSGTLSWGSAR